METSNRPKLILIPASQMDAALMKTSSADWIWVLAFEESLGESDKNHRKIWVSKRILKGVFPVFQIPLTNFVEGGRQSFLKFLFFP